MSTATEEVAGYTAEGATKPILNIASHAEETPLNDRKGETANPGSMACLATGGYEFSGIPRITDPYKKRQWQLEHMAGAFRVFARKGFTEGTSGHISVRDPVDPDTFWINP